ncbi:hypothetical protein PoB_006030000 [Plakobranchus ocellatus]|uniref:Uncharacterized protein n=1 Tax=Plakobranchus ocellatus TaxID=259542 RepID=A0AAV4CPH9_9GAST|nr:hypothetical protein PoB_006030000 [Plakobranchus ocellatus]
MLSARSWSGRGGALRTKAKERVEFYPLPLWCRQQDEINISLQIPGKIIHLEAPTHLNGTTDPINKYCKAIVLANISVYFVSSGSVLMAERTSVIEPYRFQAEFAVNYATLMPRFFKETALQQESVRGIQTREPQNESAESHCGTLLLFSSPPLTPEPSAVESKPNPG